MRRAITFALVLALLVPFVARKASQEAKAQVAFVGAHLVPMGYQQIGAGTLASATPLTVPSDSAGRAASYAFIQVDTANVRWRDDGTAPTASVGVQLASAGSFWYAGTLSAIQFIAVSGSPVLNVSYYRAP
ncbi:MAG TPA: hypothetical protein VH916_04360 [Dehalococcoidia bacterium]